MGDSAGKELQKAEMKKASRRRHVGRLKRESTHGMNGACILSKWVTVVGYCDDDDGPNRVKRTLISLKVMLSSCNAVCLYTCICIQKPLFAHRAA